LGSRENPNVYPWSEGLPESSSGEFIIIPWNDVDLLRKVVEERHSEIAAIITEPIMCNSGCIEPKDGFLYTIRELCTQYNMAFILDEVITGFRLNLGGAQKHFNITPDLSIFGKAMASGYPISAIVGKKEWMTLIDEARVIQAGTMNSSNPTVAAALATIEVLERENPYKRLYSLGKLLMKGIQEAAEKTGHKVLVQGPGPMFNIAFTEVDKVSDYRETLSADKKKLGRFISGMHDRGIRIIGRGLWYISAAHTEDDINYAIDNSFAVLEEMNQQ
jgi:glutamate-1-semialdehyde 2,1-aminomutase